jgi:hypothetical protein
LNFGTYIGKNEIEIEFPSKKMRTKTDPIKFSRIGIKGAP